jgi:glycosyltransferase involved in cell wall biosynthesis
MPLKKFGIYLAYQPTTDLRAQGLGRYLGEFLKAAEERQDIRFVIACPSWMVSTLLDLLAAQDRRSHTFEIICPDKRPLLLRVHELLVEYRSRPRRRRLARLLMRLRAFRSKLAGAVQRRIVGTRSVAWAVVLGIVLLPAAVVGILLILVPALVIGQLLRAVKRLQTWFAGLSPVRKFRRVLKAALSQPKEETHITRLYRVMLDVESALMRDMIDERRDVAAWYCPTAFWPHFQQIRAPRLMCVPDVVIAQFPVGFATVGERAFTYFKDVERAIATGTHFVTYSDDIKWRTLVGHYGVDPLAIRVVPHGANRLDELVRVSGSRDDEAATSTLCKHLVSAAFAKAQNHAYASFFKGGDGVRFMFYASQFRPNKNVISLLRAYEYLLKRRFVGCKLILTGNPRVHPEIDAFITDHNLENDVLCLYGLSDQELAACYRLADLAVNPSLSEGGFPFTFTEALSVGTPVMMARIAVTEEVITDAELSDVMLFDPFDWMDIAKRIEWGLENRDALLELQIPVYRLLAQRTWRDVVDDHIRILDEISTREAGVATAAG